MTQIEHLSHRDRWEARDEQGTLLGYLSSAMVDGVLDLQHTVVAPAARGMGLGGQLVEEALGYARAQGLQVRPSCPFVPPYIDRHPEHQDLLEGADGAGSGGSSDEHGGVGEVQQVPIRDASIRLGQLLKLSGLVPDGAMARMVIENGEVTLDGEPSLRRGTQVRPGQVVTYAGESATPVFEG